MTLESARAVARAVDPNCADADGDFLRAQICRVPPPLGVGVRLLARFFAVSPTPARLQKWRRGPFPPLRDFAALCAALVCFSMRARAENEPDAPGE